MGLAFVLQNGAVKGWVRLCQDSCVHFSPGHQKQKGSPASGLHGGLGTGRPETPVQAQQWTDHQGT